MLSLWAGMADDSYFSYEKLQKLRKLKNPEMHAISRGHGNEFYLLAIDVGRLSDQTVCCVFRVNVNPTTNKHICALVNLFVLGREAKTKTFYQQAIDIKKLIELYNPKEVVIDTNGLGIGLGDEMIRSQVDDKGVTYPPYGFFNDDNYIKIQPKGISKILYGIKANSNLNSEIHSNVYSKLTGGAVRFLIKEQEAKNIMLSTKKGQRMSMEERVKRLMPHELTTKLFEEMAQMNRSTFS